MVGMVGMVGVVGVVGMDSAVEGGILASVLASGA